MDAASAQHLNEEWLYVKDIINYINDKCLVVKNPDTFLLWINKYGWHKIWRLTTIIVESTPIQYGWPPLLGRNSHLDAISGWVYLLELSFPGIVSVWFVYTPTKNIRRHSNAIGRLICDCRCTHTSSQYGDLPISTASL